MGTGSSSKQTGKLFQTLYGEIQAKLFNDFLSVEEKLLFMYQEAYESVISDIAKLYEKYSVSGKLTFAQMSKFNRLKNLEKQISEKLIPRFRKSDNYIKKITGMIYEESFYHHAWAIDQDAGGAIKWGILRDSDIESIVYSPLSKLADSKALMSDKINAVYRIRKTITLGLVRGEGYPEMAKRIQDVIGLQSSPAGTLSSNGKGLLYKSTMIARTEGQRAVVEGQLKAYKKAEEEGIDILQKWDAALDSKTRPEHGKLDGKTRQDKGWYVPSIGWVSAPLQSGVASFDIHCRCRVRAELEGYPPTIRGQKGNGQKPWVDYETWKNAAKKKGSAKSVKPKPQSILKPNGIPVSQALDIKTKKYAAHAQHAIKQINQVHGDGKLPRIPINTSRAKSFNGAYSRDNPIYGDNARDISIAGGGHVELTVVHEIGHFLDHKGLPKSGMATQNGVDEVMKLLQVINDSPEIQELKNLRKTNPYAKKHINYLLKPEERFARAYSQYIARKSGDKKLLEQVENVIINSHHKSDRLSLWDDDNFDTIEQAFDELFEGQGWLKR